MPPKSNRKAKIRWNRRLYRERHRIERMIGHLKINRAIATNYGDGVGAVHAVAAAPETSAVGKCQLGPAGTRQRPALCAEPDRSASGVAVAWLRKAARWP